MLMLETSHVVFNIWSELKIISLPPKFYVLHQTSNFGWNFINKLFLWIKTSFSAVAEETILDARR